VNKNNKTYYYPFVSIDLNIRENYKSTKFNNFFLGKGSIYISKKGSLVEWKVLAFEEVLYMIDHFNNYPLLGFKYINFCIWKDIVKLIKEKSHLDPEGIQKIENLLKLWINEINFKIALICLKPSQCGSSCKFVRLMFSIPQ
jgi:hypothetical protein